MTINRIVALNLETKAKELKLQNKSEEQIADLLSRESNKKITRSSVHRYFAAQAEFSRELVQKKEELQVKTVELELDTIKKRHTIYEKLEGLVKKAEDERLDKTLIEALKVQIAALDSLDKRLGRFTEKREVEVKGAAVVFYIPDNGRDKQKEIESA